jgi:hypothetical protein
MSTGDKLDNKLDSWLGPWPVAERPQQAFDEMADRVQARLARVSPGSAEPDWLTAPFPSQPEEGSLSPVQASGGLSMSEGTDKPSVEEPTSERASARPAESARPGPDEADKPRRSLKDIAKRVSVPPPAPADAAAPAATSSTGTPLPMTSRSSEAGEGDSGVLDLKAVREQANSIPDTGGEPASAGLFDEDEAKPAAAAATAARAAPKKSSTTPLIVGSAVALAAIAAVAILSLRARPEAAPVQSAPAAASVAVVEAPPAATATAAPTEAQEQPAATASAAPAPGPLALHEPKSAAGLGGREATPKAEDSKEKPAAAAPAAPGDPASLQGAMDTAVGGNKAPAKTDEPAAKSPAHGSDIPEIPSQGAIQGAMGSVMGAARACVAGMDEPSKAQVTFSNDGKVQNVSVSGPAAGKPAAGCIVAALKRARVTPFQRSSYSVGVTIRP